MEKESHSCKIVFNVPTLTTKRDSAEFNQEIMIDNRSSLREAKNIISKKVEEGG